jgi:hypothetical protein
MPNTRAQQWASWDQNKISNSTDKKTQSQNTLTYLPNPLGWSQALRLPTAPNETELQNTAIIPCSTSGWWRAKGRGQPHTGTLMSHSYTSRSITVQDSNILWPPIWTPLFWSLVTHSHKSGWGHIASTLVSPTLPLLQRPLSEQSISAFIKWGSLLLCFMEWHSPSII